MKSVCIYVLDSDRVANEALPCSHTSSFFDANLFYEPRCHVTRISIEDLHMHFRVRGGPVAYKPAPNMTPTFGVDLSRRYKFFVRSGFNPSLPYLR